MENMVIYYSYGFFFQIKEILGGKEVIYQEIQLLGKITREEEAIT